MGTFQSITLRGTTAEAVKKLVDWPRVWAVGNDVVVYPAIELSAEHLYQQEEPFRTLTAELSHQLNCTALGAVNLEDAALLLWVYDRGRPVFAYDSNPMYLGCPVCSYSSDTVSAEYGNVEHLSSLLGVPQNRKALKSWLSRRKGLGFLREQERLEKIFGLLGLPLPTPG